MASDRVKLAAVLAVSAAFLASCERNCRDPRDPHCRSGGGAAHGAWFWGGGRPLSGTGAAASEGVARGGFGATGEGVGGAHGGGAGE